MVHVYVTNYTVLYGVIKPLKDVQKKINTAVKIYIYSILIACYQIRLTQYCVKELSDSRLTSVHVVSR